MRNEKMYDPKQKFYALKTFKLAGRDLKRGDEFPSRDLSNRKLLQFFQNGFIGYSTDFKTNKVSMKDVELQETPEEVPAEETVIETSKPAPKKRGRKKQQDTE
jgi:hypothetical protein